MGRLKKFIAIVCMLIGIDAAVAQQTYSLQESVQYGLKNHMSVKNAELEIYSAENTINQIKAAGLPQINGQFGFTSNIIIPTQLIKASNFNPQAGPDDVVKFKFGVPWAGQAGIGVNQLIFDATWLVGLKAAPIYRELAQRSVANSKVTVAENITKAYLSVLVAEERSKILGLNINRLDSLIRDMTVMNQQGFIEKLDLDRLEVQRNNLLTENQKIQNLIQLSYNLLKFQMGMNLNEPIKLTQRLSDFEGAIAQIPDYQGVNYTDRIEYSTLMSQRKMAELDVQRIGQSRKPKVFISGSLGAGHSNPRFNPFERWFPSSAVTLGLQVPIYDSGLRKYQLEQGKINLTKIDQSANMLRQLFDFQATSAVLTMKNGLEGLQVQRRNMELAKEVARISKIKYQQGVGSNIEIINAETSLKEAQTNYFAALYDVLVAKVDYDKALGKLSLD